MTPKITLIFLAIVLLNSCSTDQENQNGTEENSIIGTWDVTELRIDEATASDGTKNGRDIIDFLTARNCYILSVTFNEDLSLVTENSGNYLEINVNSESTGIDVPCPTEKDRETATYVYTNSSLSVVDDSGEMKTVNVTIIGDTMTLNAADLGISNFDGGGELVFRRR